MEKNLDFLKHTLFAHRGYFNISLGIPENSIPAFERAIQYQYGIELDVHILKDGKVVVFHDNNLKRMTGKDALIKDFTYPALKSLTLLQTPYSIPLFSEVLSIVAGKVPLLIELKYDTKIGLLEKEVIKLLQNYSGNYAIESFDPFRIYWLRKNFPSIIRGQLSSSFSNDTKFSIPHKLLKNLFFNFLTKPDFIAYGLKDFPKEQIQKWREKYLLLAWTVKTSSEYEDVKPYFDNFICENMETF